MRVPGVVQTMQPMNTNTALQSPDHDTQWNTAHILALVLLPAYAVATHAAGWTAFATLAVHLFLTLAWFGLFERYRPYRAAWTASPAALRRDATFFGMNAVADGLAGLLVATVAVWWAGEVGPAGSLSLWAALPLAVVVAEFGAYWLHRGMHAGGWWWRVHAVHHRPEALNVANNLTAHPVNVFVLKLVKMLPLVALGFTAEAVLYASLFLQLQSFATHANTRGRMGCLNYLIGTAQLHRRHHSVNVSEALNFATALPLWDQVFGTFRYRSTGEPQRVGVEPAQQYPQETETWELLRHPFRQGPRPRHSCKLPEAGEEASQG
jgi:sterol desaturase/sphingolipid hydroxylase (fatty acid hydroxylase superfamily)